MLGASPHVAEADVRVRLEGRNGYLDPAQVIAAAKTAGADAIHPGYGYARADSTMDGRRIVVTTPVAASSSTARSPIALVKV